jgi:hypothetical protein
MDMIKNICKNIITDAARHISTVIVAAMCIFPSCTDYLDIVPDNTLTLDDIFSTRKEAYNALAKVYYYLPPDANFTHSSYLLGDDYQQPVGFENLTANNKYPTILSQLNSATLPIMGHWAGTDGGYPLYQAINTAYIFMNNIDKVNDMVDSEKKEWKAQAKFLLAYYHFILLRQTGPIVLREKESSIFETDEELYPRRAKIDDCFDFILRKMDEAIPDLVEQRVGTDIGQIDRIGAAAIKARVLLYRASPFYNGNSEFYSGFLNHENEPFFPQTYNKEKWKDAVDGINEAIELAIKNDKGLYTYENAPYSYDREDFEKQPDRMKTLYDVRMIFPDPWNKELLWGLSKLTPGAPLGLSTWDYVLTSCAQIPIYATMNPPVIVPPGSFVGYAAGAYGWLGSNFRMLERFYTENGLPIDEDPSFNRSTMYNQFTIPGITDPAYEQYRGYLYPGAVTLELYLNREARFYADLGITGGYWRSQNMRIPTTFFYNQSGGNNAAQYSNANRHLGSSIGVQKILHPESIAFTEARIVKAPFPIIRMADLYLMKAEALNEYLETPTNDVYDAINLVRDRAGIPTVQQAWSSARTVNNHQTKEGMRDIILQERSIELAFEGQHFWDMYRYKKAHIEFTGSFWGWNDLNTGTTPTAFFVLKKLGTDRLFTFRDYLWPLPTTELNINSNLIQNPGW